ncbi:MULTISPECIES: hypothetical protein [Halobacterium]|uniref:hypothetical protein n=1 Tax=Halobacterium TaxID=2239 RepID=UPI00073E9F83|nr:MULTISPECIES: hypothetical protein [Halobacterium]MCG1002874.1 hypothetical protein [Halobacterium noricense]
MTSRELTISYREACRNYGYGFTLGAFMTTTFLAVFLEWTTVAQGTVRMLFLMVAVIGCTTGLAARYRPVWFYELLEGPYHEDEDADVEEVDG